MRTHNLQGLLGFILILAVVAAAVLLTPQKSQAIPPFARKYQTSCTTCHSDFPKLNDFGKAFKDAGFKFPKDDESFIKEPPVMLGAPAQKEMFPHTVWPGTIPGMPPIGLRMNNFFQVVGRSASKFNTLSPPGQAPFIPRTDFQSGLFSIFTAGNFGDDIAFWVDDDLSIAGDNANGGLGDGYLKFVNLGRVLKLPTDSLSLRAGQFELDLPITQARNINLSPYDIYTQANFGQMNPAFALQQNVNNNIAIADAARGVEISGGHTYGGYHYSIALVDQNTSASAANASSFVPSANGVGFSSDANYKDLYGRFSYRINLDRDKAARAAIQAAGATGPRDHTYLSLGTFYYYGRSAQRFLGQDSTGSPITLSAHEPFYRTGGDFNFNYHTFNLFGVFMYGRDHNLLPVDETGAIIPLPLDPAASPVPVTFVRGTPESFTGGFVEADYQVLPWVMAIMRWDAVNSAADRVNGLTGAPAGSFAVPYRATRNRFSPAMQFLIHPNLKASFEYQFRPQQVVTFGTDPATGLPIAQNPFRTNTLLIGLEFVY